MLSKARVTWPSVTWRDVPVSVWALGFVSLLMDIWSELIDSLLPVFLVTVIGASTVIVGLIEGVAEATATIAKIFSGALSDRIRKRKLQAFGPTATFAAGAAFSGLAALIMSASMSRWNRGMEHPL